MQLTRQNFIDHIIIANNIELVDNKPFLNKKGNELLRYISEKFYDNTLVYRSEIRSDLKLESTKFFSSNEKNYREKWIEDVIQLDIRYLIEFYLRQYFEKTGEFHYNDLLVFLRESYYIKDEWSIYFKRFYLWFIARYLQYVVPTVNSLVMDLKEKFKNDPNFISFDLDRFYVFEKAPIVDYFNQLTNNYVKFSERKVFGIFFENTENENLSPHLFRYYVMYDDGEIVDKLSNKRKNFDPVLAMLTQSLKTM